MSTVYKKNMNAELRLPDSIYFPKWRKLVAKERLDEYFKPNSSSVVCSKHFLESDMYFSNKGFRRLKKTAIPQIGLADDSQETERGISQEESETEQLNESQDSDDLIVVIKEERSPSQEIINIPDDKSTLSGISTPSFMDTPELYYYRKELKKCQDRLLKRDKQFRNLQKRHKRLIKANSSMRKIIQDLREKIK